MRRLLATIILALAPAMGQAQTYTGTLFPSSSPVGLLCTVASCTFSAPIIGTTATFTTAVLVSNLGASGSGMLPSGGGGLNFRNDNGFASTRVIFTALVGGGLQVSSTDQYGFSSAGAAAASNDAGLARAAAGSLRVTNGSTGNGYLSAALFNLMNAGNTQNLLQIVETPAVNMASGTTFNWSNSATDATSTKDIGLARNAAGVIRATDGSTAIKGFLGGGATVASATALPVPTGSVFHVSGTTSITSITSTNFGSGAIITIIFDGILTFTDGNNLKLAGNMTTSADDTITLAYDGTNWYEIARAVN